MSGAATGYARKLPVVKTERGLIGLIADNANHDHGFAWPSIGTLARETGCSERHVKRMLKGFVDAGYLVRFDVFCRFSGRQRASAYWFPIDGPEPKPAQIKAYENEVGGLLRRWVSKGEGDTHVTPSGRAEGDARVTPEGDLGVTPGVTPESPLEPPIELPVERPQSAGASAGSQAVQAAPQAPSPDLFAQAFAGWPDAGRKHSSEREGGAAWEAELAAGGDSERMARACRAYAGDRKAWGVSGVPLSFQKFIQSGRWQSFAPVAIPGPAAPAAAAAAAAARLNGPAGLRDKLVVRFGEDWALSWFDPCAWASERLVLTAANGVAFDKLQREAGRVISDFNVTLARPLAAALAG